MVRISDARMSGTSYGACVLHVAPESFVGGPLALVRDGDLIELDVAARKLELEGERRRARPPPRRMEAAAAALRARLRRALPAAHHAGRPGLRLRFPRGRRADAGAGDPLDARRAGARTTRRERHQSETSRRRRRQLCGGVWSVALTAPLAHAQAWPVEADQVGRAVRARRHHRHPRAHGRRKAARRSASRSSSRTSPARGGGVGAEFVARAAPDGYTIMGGTISTHAINASLYQEPAVRPGEGFRADQLHRARAEHAGRQSRRAGEERRPS